MFRKKMVVHGYTVGIHCRNMYQRYHRYNFLKTMKAISFNDQSIKPQTINSPKLAIERIRHSLDQRIETLELQPPPGDVGVFGVRYRRWIVACGH